MIRQRSEPSALRNAEEIEPTPEESEEASPKMKYLNLVLITLTLTPT
jgi:hypothetical protein